MLRDSWRGLREHDALRNDDSRHAIHVAELDSDHHNPFHRTESDKGRWLLTTCVAGVAGGLVIGAALLGTFGIGPLGSIGPDADAAPWQMSASTLKSDRIYSTFGVAQIVSHTEVSEVVAEKPYKRISVAFDRAEEPIGGTPRDRITITPAASLVGSLAPDYTDIVNGKPTVLSSPDFRLASIDPTAANSTIISKTPYVSADSLPYDETVVLSRGADLLSVLLDKGVTPERARKLVAEVRRVKPDLSFHDGQQLNLTVQLGKDMLGRDVLEPLRLSFVGGPGQEVVVEMDENGRYAGQLLQGGNVASAGRERVRSRARIRKSLYVAAKEQGIPEHVIVEMMRVHSYDVDFQREIRVGDSFDVFYGAPRDGDDGGRDVVLYSALTLSGETKGYYRFTTPDDGITDYYDENGKSATKFLMRTPVSGARMSSKFGMRKHPIIGYNKMHTGLDFAAPYGTPVKAGGSGVIEQIGRVGAYGNYIRIRHPNNYKTAYAHLSRFASGLKKGSKVRQGQVIGYVGSTGRSTGPHLHYEVHVDGRPVNPLTLKIPTGRQLSGPILAAFLEEKARIDSLMAVAPTSTEVAAANQEKDAEEN